MNAASKAVRPAAALRSVVGSALAAVLLAGCTTASTADGVASTTGKVQGRSLRDADRGVAQAEKAVEKQPSQVALRVSLGQAYMKAGRFESAITAFNDAIELGDQEPRTALSLALSNIAIGRNDEAVTILDDWRQELSAVDIGLAYALAGQAQRGTAILANAVRDGDATAQARQNFAYALALEGRWREARIMMSQDLTSDVINNRIGKWAALASGDDPRVRIAVMLGTPVRADAGQPAQLALVVPSTETLAHAPATEADAVPTEVYSASGPALTDAAPVSVQAPPLLAAAEPTEDVIARPSFVSTPIVQQVPALLAKQARAAAAPARRSAHKPATVRPVPSDGTHLVQLGSFTSEQGARRAWDIYVSRDAALRNYRMKIIPVTVNGQNYWRVAAAGFDAGTAQRMCGSIKSKGGACLTYANTHLPVPNDRGGPQMARRR